MNEGVKLTAPYTAHLYTLARELNPQARQTLLIEPQMRQQFQCSGCGECCQRPWAISVSQSYYEHWQKHFEEDPSGRFRNALQKYPQPTAEKYANITRKPGTHECVFLEDDRKCHLQKNYGEEALSKVCRTYPRYEQWQGLFVGRFLATGCPDVADLWQQFPDVYVQPIQVADSLWQEWVPHPHPMNPLVGTVWTGLTLDLVNTPYYSAQENLRRIVAHLQTMTRHALAEIHLDQVYEWYQTLSQATAPLPSQTDKMPQAFQGLLHYAQILPLLHRFLQEIQQGLIASPVLHEPERQLLNRFMNHYLRYRLLSLRIDPDKPQMGFFHSYFELSVQTLLLQWLALYYRYRDQGPLNPHHLIRAFTQIGYRLEGSRELDKPAFQLKDIPTLLEAAATLLLLDPGKAPHV